MRKRKINPQYLRHITSQEIKDEAIDANDFAYSLDRFAREYLNGLVDFSIIGTSMGFVNLKLPVTSYLIRLIAECESGDEVINLDISLSDAFTMTATYKSPCMTEDVAHIVNIARLAGFEVSRDGNSLIFKACILTTSILQVYATSVEDFYSMLVTTFKM